jgi:hypothetical protein
MSSNLNLSIEHLDSTITVSSKGFYSVVYAIEEAFIEIALS